MLHILHIGDDYEENSKTEVLSGPDVDLASFWTEFNKLFDVERMTYPEYNGPVLPPVTPLLGRYAYASGAIGSDYKVVNYDRESPEYKAHFRQCQEVNDENQRRYDAKHAEVASRYPGETREEMFVACLIQEHGFRRVEHKVTAI